MNPNLPVGGSAFDLELGGRGAPPAGLTQLSAAFQYGHFATEYRGDEAHDPAAGQRLQAFFTTLALRHHFGDGWAADVVLPVGFVRHDPGDDLPVGRVSGLGDLELGARYDLGALWDAGGYRPNLTLRLGLGLPTGGQGTTGSPVGSSPEVEVPPTLLSIGNAAFAWSAQLELTQFVHPRVALAVPVSARQPITATEKGTTFGTTVDYGLSVIVLPSTWLTLIGTESGTFRERTREQGKGEVVQSGGHWLAAEVLAGFRATDRLSFAVRGRVPMYTHVNGTQLSETFSASALMSVTFGGDKPRHGHGHKHD